ncbi:MAG: hypothetical protein AAGA48_11035 [Myxococcota bacterium]
MNPYQSPQRAEGAAEDLLDDPTAIRPTVIGQAAGVVTMMGGATLALGAVQLATMFLLRTGEMGTVALLFTGGLVLLGLGPAVMKSRHGATVIVTMIGAVATLLTGGWVAYALIYGGALSLLLMFGVAISALATLLAAIAIGPAGRVTAARAQLYE